MTLPLFDPIALPPDHSLIDINGLTPDSVREQYQAAALELWMTEVELDWSVMLDREWDDNEGIFVVTDGAGDIVGVAIILDVEDA